MSRPDPFAKYGGKADEDPFAKYGGQADKPSLAADINPTLLASRQAASKSAFEANLPENKQGLAEGFVRGVTKSVAGIPVGLGNLVLGGAEKVRQAVDPYGMLPKVPQLPESANYAVEPMTPQEQSGTMAGNVGMLAQALGSGGVAGYRKISGMLSTGADASTVAAIQNIRKLNPITPEAQATAGRIAQEAVTRGSVPEAANLPVRDSKVFQQFEKSQTELQAAKTATNLAQQSTPGKPLFETLDSAIAREQVPPTVRPQFGMQTTSVQGGPYTPITSFQKADPVSSGRVQGLQQARAQIQSLMDNNGNIRADKLQQAKEILDKNIFDHSGWKDTGTAADKANLQALREANGYVRETLRNLGNTRLNDANDAYSHMSDVAKIVDIRRPDLAGLDLAEKSRAALMPMAGTPGEQFVRATAKKAVPYVVGGGLAGKLGYDLMKASRGTKSGQ